MTMVVGVFNNLMTRSGIFIYTYLIQICKMPLGLQIISIHYGLGCFTKTNDKRWNNVGSNIWMRKSVYVFHCLLSDVFSIKIISNISDRVIDTPGYGKDVVDGFNAVQKRYLDTCLIMYSMPEVDMIDSKLICVDVMTEKGEVIFSKEFKHFLDLRDEIGTKGDKKHTKQEAKARLKHK